MAERPTALIVEDHESIRTTLVLALRRWVRVVGEAATPEAAIAIARRTGPRLILLDLGLPRPEDGLRTLHRLRELGIHARILVVSAFGESPWIERALGAGARGFFLKEQSFDELVHAIHVVCAGDRYVCGEVRPEDEVPDAVHDPFRVLTGREIEVLRHLLEGKTNDEAGKALGITGRTVETHRWHIMRKMKTNNLAELARLAIRHGLLRP